MMRFVTARRAFASMLIAVCATASAATIYRWVDDAGRIHLSDSVPDAYKSRATRIDSHRFDIPADELAQAQQQAAREKAAAATVAPPPSSAMATAPAPPSAHRSMMTEAALEKLDCKTQWKLYRDSLECFAPYIQQDPWIAPPEAFQHCTWLKDPSERCPSSEDR